jgi:heat shock protein HtpX
MPACWGTSVGTTGLLSLFLSVIRFAGGHGAKAALRKLDRAQCGRWESILLPGGRIPDPSILRTHPSTEDRIARLAALETGAARSPLDPFGAGPPRSRRPSMIPRIRLHLPHDAFSAHFLLGAADMDTEFGALPACATRSIGPPAPPWIRALGGGVCGDRPLRPDRTAGTGLRRS